MDVVLDCPLASWWNAGFQLLCSTPTLLTVFMYRSTTDQVITTSLSNFGSTSRLSGFSILEALVSTLKGHVVTSDTRRVLQKVTVMLNSFHGSSLLYKPVLPGSTAKWIILKWLGRDGWRITSQEIRWCAPFQCKQNKVTCSATSLDGKSLAGASSIEQIVWILMKRKADRELSGSWCAVCWCGWVECEEWWWWFYLAGQMSSTTAAPPQRQRERKYNEKGSKGLKGLDMDREMT